MSLLLARHADTSAEDTQGFTALSFAAAFAHKDVLRQLLSVGSNPNKQAARHALGLLVCVLITAGKSSLPDATAGGLYLSDGIGGTAVFRCH